MSGAARPAGPLKVGILLEGFAGLAGAADFIVSLADAMQRTKGGNQLVAIYRLPASPWTVRGLASWSLRSLRALLRRQPSPTLVEKTDVQATASRLQRAGLPELQLLVIPGGEQALLTLCRDHGIDAVLPLTAALSAAFPVPWIGYIFDFQHRALTRYFSARERRRRDRLFGALLARASVVIANAQAVLADARRFAGHFPAELIALPFSAAPSAAWFDTDPAATQQKYGVGRRYFMISNQFWIHKRHDLAFRAFALLTAEHPDVELVCTGATEDWRSPGYFQTLMKFVNAKGLSRRIHILGLIDKLDQIALMRGTIAVIQPTEFEGGPGGGAVFDAVSLGVPTVVSDIPVNCEIARYVTRYFRADDGGSLLEQMRAVLGDPAPALTPADLLAAGLHRRESMGRALWQATERAIERTEDRLGKKVTAP